MSLDPAADAARASQGRGRLQSIDAARGVALVAMAVYHFSWDLRYFNYISADVTRDLGWVIFARLIAGSFLFLVGVSLVLATRRGFNRRAYLIRLAKITGAAAAITVVTYFVFPDSYIFFGILHHIALASVLALPFLRLPVPLVAAAAAAFVALPFFYSSPFFDHPALQWLGLMTYGPRTNDYVPVFPWFGIVLAGTIAARMAHDMRLKGMLHAPHVLSWAGRHSLAIYLIHQPLLFGLVFLAAQIIPVPQSVRESNYLKSCENSCLATGAEAAICRPACQCVAAGVEEEGLWAPVLTNSLDPSQELRYRSIADRCLSAPEN